MPKISFGYGLAAEDSFWVKNHIFEARRLRDSKDEEVLAKTIIGILMKNFDASPDVLDSIYKEGSQQNEKITSRIDEYGDGNELLENLAEVGRVVVDLYSLGIIECDNSVYKKNELRFRIFFTALFYAHSDGVDISKFDLFAHSISERINIIDTDNLNSTSNWSEAVESVCEVIKGEGLYSSTVHSPIVRDIEMRLLESAYESQMTEYKLGITALGKSHPYVSQDGSPNYTIERVAKTLSAMVNTHSIEQNGCVIFGVADSKKQAEQWKECYLEDYITYKDHYITGVDAEIRNCFENSDAYSKFIIDEMKKCCIDEAVLSYVEQNIRFVEFGTKQLLIIPAPALKRTVVFGVEREKFYRSGACNKKIS